MLSNHINLFAHAKSVRARASLFLLLDVACARTRVRLHVFAFNSESLLECHVMFSLDVRLCELMRVVLLVCNVCLCVGVHTPRGFLRPQCSREFHQVSCSVSSRCCACVSLCVLFCLCVVCNV